MQIEELTERIREAHGQVGRVRDEVSRVIVGQGDLIDRLLVALFTKGHILIEGVPGLAKTTAVRALAKTVSAGFRRIQFTPDLLPADLVGTEVFRPREGDFVVRHGPVFDNIILADEINRAPSKVQSALLEAMQERQVTIGDRTYPLPDPFLVLATQNPIEQEGTYPLPEAQVDRFMLKVMVDYPGRDDEKEIVRRSAFGAEAGIEEVVGPEEIAAMQKLISVVHMDERLLDYIVDLVRATRTNGDREGSEIAPYIQVGASPRAAIYLAVTTRAHAFLRGRAYVTPEDVKAMAPDVLRHRVLLTYEAEAEGIGAEELVLRILETVEVP